MARVEVPFTVADTDGNAVTGADVTITYRDSAVGGAAGTQTTVYAAETGGTTLSQPLHTVDGRIDGWVVSDAYDVNVSGANLLTYTQAWDATSYALDTVTSGMIVDGTIATGDLADDSVTVDKLADNSVTSAQIVNGTIVAADIADGTITGAKVAGLTLTGANIADASITAAKLSIGVLGIPEDSVTSFELANSAVAGANIANDAVTNSKILDGTITGSKLTATTVTPEKMAPDITKYSLGAFVGLAPAEGDLAGYSHTCASDGDYLVHVSARFSAFASTYTTDISAHVYLYSGGVLQNNSLDCTMQFPYVQYPGTFLANTSACTYWLPNLAAATVIKLRGVKGAATTASVMPVVVIQRLSN